MGDGRSLPLPCRALSQHPRVDALMATADIDAVRRLPRLEVAAQRRDDGAGDGHIGQRSIKLPGHGRIAGLDDQVPIALVRQHEPACRLGQVLDRLDGGLTVQAEETARD
ncbi:hypothetical protein D3C76_991270 [compost metagenome]